MLIHSFQAWHGLLRSLRMILRRLLKTLQTVQPRPRKSTDGGESLASPCLLEYATDGSLMRLEH